MKIDNLKRALFSLALIIAMTTFLLTSCTNDDDDDDDIWNPPPAGENMLRDIISTDLNIDITNLTGTAMITVGSEESEAVSFEADGLVINDVYCVQGALNYSMEEGRLDVGIPQTDEPFELIIDYTFSYQDTFEGYMESGVTLIWPYYCGNLFPCHSEPVDGLTFNLTLYSYDETIDAIYPEVIGANCPSYQIAWALGDYKYLSLGQTSAGTEVGLWIFAEDENKARSATTYLVEIFNWYEQVLGPYPFGGKAGTVEVIWGAGGIGGMEHHPYWHIAKGAIGMKDIHTHEAAHGWYGDGIRIECWEDFVLSEGTVTYLTARVTGQVAGAAAESEIWQDYENDLNNILNHNDGIAWPDSCGEVDILEDGLFSRVPYIKGAYFYKAVADEIGADTLDQVLSSFFLTHVGHAALMQDMVDHIYYQTGFDATELANGWLRSYGRPD